MNVSAPLLHAGAAIVVALGATGCPGCPCVAEDEDDELEENDSPDDAKSLASGSVVAGVVADCDADFFSFDLADDAFFDLFLTGPNAGVDVADSFSSGGILVGMTGSDGQLVSFSGDTGAFGGEGEGEGEPGPPTVPTSKVVFQGSNANVHLIIPTGFGGTYVINVEHDGYVDNIFPVVANYTLSVSAGPP